MDASHLRFRGLYLYTQEGTLACRFYEAPGATSGVLFLGGVAGGFDSPGRDLFDRIADELVDRDASSLRLRYRSSSDLEASVEDALAGIEFLVQRRIERIVLVGFSFGGAVAIQAGAASPSCVGVAALATQSAGTSGVNRLTPRPLLLIHGGKDNIMPPECAELVFQRAGEPKRLVILPNAGHCFDEAVAEVHDLLTDWIAGVLVLPPAFSRASI
ncbi:MAG TPA: dienelactone hydrolase family protein [Chloroflexota bacterium]|nr:dienelactone hydrolase family protein [Chloroflexota bacterium]